MPQIFLKTAVSIFVLLTNSKTLNYETVNFYWFSSTVLSFAGCRLKEVDELLRLFAGLRINRLLSFTLAHPYV